MAAERDNKAHQSMRSAERKEGQEPNDGMAHALSNWPSGLHGAILILDGKGARQNI